MSYMSREKKRTAEREGSVYADFCEFAKDWLMPEGCVQQPILIVYFRDNFSNDKYKYSDSGSDEEIVNAINKWNASDAGYKAEMNDFGLYIGFQLNMEKGKQKRQEDELNKRREEIKLTLAESKKFGVKPPLDVLKEACELGIIPVPEATLRSMEEVRQKRASMAAPSSGRSASRRASTSALPHGNMSSSSRKTRAQSTFQPKLPAAVALALKRKKELEENYRPYEQAKVGKAFNPFEGGTPMEQGEDEEESEVEEDVNFGDGDRQSRRHHSSSRKISGSSHRDDRQHQSSSKSPPSSSRRSSRLGKSMSDLDSYTRDSSPHRHRSSSRDKKEKDRKSSSSHRRKSSSFSQLGKSMSELEHERSSSSRHRDRDEKDRKRDKKEKDRKSSSSSRRLSSSNLGKSMSAFENSSSSHRDRDKDKDRDRKSEKRDKERKSSSSDRRSSSSRVGKSMSDLEDQKSSRRDKDRDKEKDKDRPSTKRDKDKKSSGSRHESSSGKDRRTSGSSSRPTPGRGGLVKQLSKTFLGSS